MVNESQIAEHLQHEREAGDCEQACGLCGAAVEMTMGDVERAREKASFDPGHLILAPAFAEHRIAFTTQANESLLEEISARGKRFARGNFKDHTVHVHVAGKVEIDAAPFDLRPRMNFLCSGVENRVTFDLRYVALFQPVAIKIALDSTSTSDVRRAEFLFPLT